MFVATRLSPSCYATTFGKTLRRELLKGIAAVVVVLRPMFLQGGLVRVFRVLVSVFALE